MSAGDTYCRIELVGNVGRDPLVRYLDEKTCMASFTVATDSPLPDDPGGEVTDWHDIRCYHQPAHYAETHIRKGDKVLIKGRLSYKKIRLGEERYLRKALIIAEEIRTIYRSGADTSGSKSTGEGTTDQYLSTLSKDAESDLPF